MKHTIHETLNDVNKLCNYCAAVIKCPHCAKMITDFGNIILQLGNT